MIHSVKATENAFAAKTVNLKQPAGGFPAARRGIFS